MPSSGKREHDVSIMYIIFKASLPLKDTSKTLLNQKGEMISVAFLKNISCVLQHSLTDTFEVYARTVHFYSSFKKTGKSLSRRHERIHIIYQSDLRKAPVDSTKY